MASKTRAQLAALTKAGQYRQTAPTECSACGQAIEWGPILTRSAGLSNIVWGSCACGDRSWLADEHYGRWDRYWYMAGESEVAS